MSRGIAVAHTIEGDPGGPVLVLLNSLGSSYEMWDPQVEALSRSFRLIRFDLRGHGRSPVPVGPYAIEDLGADLLTLLDQLAVERAHLCGLSIGGMVALWVAAHAGERVDRLVAACSSAQLTPAAAWTNRATLVRAEGTAVVADAVVGRWFTPGFAVSHPALVASMRSMVAATPAEGYASCCDAIAAMDLRSSLRAIRAPTLLLAAADDPAIPPDHSERLAAAIAGSRLIVIRGAAHMANVEQPAQVTAAILDHCRAAPGREAS